MKALKTSIKSFEVPQRSVKIKIWLNFFSSSGIGTGRVNVKPSPHYFHMKKTKILAVFQICISVTLNHHVNLISRDAESWKNYSNIFFHGNLWYFKRFYDHLKNNHIFIYHKESRNIFFVNFLFPFSLPHFSLVLNFT